MASVTSLGLHQPTGLQYAIQERLLPRDPPTSSYTWQTHIGSDPGSLLSEDELLITSRCVIWSRGGVFRKCYKFDLEKEPVTQALFTTFPSVRPLAARDRKSAKEDASNTRSAAIVVFLKTQAHIYFISGTSHVIHLPFEVESAAAAPHGIILQRKLRVDNLIPASFKFPRVPPNSFVSSQPQAWSPTSSQQSTFSIADLNAPKQMPLPPTSTLKDLWESPALQNDSNWPRLFSLSDPLAEMGLVVAQGHKAERGGRRRSSAKITTLDTAEEILHVTRRNEFSHPDAKDSLVLALTLNRETSIYSVWKLSYIGQENGAKDNQRVPSGTISRRRSSFVPGSGTGATTPVAGGHQPRRESLGLITKAYGQDDELRSKTTDFVSTLDPDFEGLANPRRKSRRVSSMLARADLSASHERSAFTDLASAHQNVSSRRGESLGSQHGRVSSGQFGTMNGPNSLQSQFSHSISSLLEAPVDELLDELRAGGDFEGFHNMGLDDDEFDALRQEIIFTKVCSVPAEHSNVRYSSQHVPAKNQCRIFTLSAPTSTEQDQQTNTIVICILDTDEKRLLVLTLYAKVHQRAYSETAEDGTKGSTKGNQIVAVVKLGPVTRAKGVIDACRLDDGRISRILVLTETPDGYGELSLQAPWSMLMKVPLPRQFNLSNIRNLSHATVPRAKREGGFKRVLSQGPRALCGLRNSTLRGLVDLVDSEGRIHQLQLMLQPRNPRVCKVIEVCRAVNPGSRGGEGFLVAWWHAMQWLRLEAIDTADMEWTALVITLFSMIFGMSELPKTGQTRAHAKRKPRSGHLRSGSGTQASLESWDIMQRHETWNGNPCPSWAENRGWKWLGDDEEKSHDLSNKPNLGLQSPIFAAGAVDHDNFVQEHVKYARDFVTSALGQGVSAGCLPTTGNKGLQSRTAALTDTFVALHLLREEEKLDTMTSDSFTTGVASLTPILSQLARWLGWTNWISIYDVEEASALDIVYDTSSPIAHPPEPLFSCPSIYDWIQMCLMTRHLTEFITLQDLVLTRSSKLPQHVEEWARLTPRTLLFANFFSSMKDDWSSVDFVTALSAAGMKKIILETLPEAVLIPLQEAIVRCQATPPTTWSKTLLAIVGREDVNVLLTPGSRPRFSQPYALLVSVFYFRKHFLTAYRHHPTSQTSMCTASVP